MEGFWGDYSDGQTGLLGYIKKGVIWFATKTKYQPIAIYWDVLKVGKIADMIKTCFKFDGVLAIHFFQNMKINNNSYMLWIS